MTLDPLADPITQSQGGVPHLLEYLWARYREFLKDELDGRAEAGKPAGTLEEALRRAPATSFVRWASDFLRDNRVVEAFFIDDNHGLRLTDNALVAVCPGVDLRGTMQESRTVAITSGRSQPGLEGVKDQGGQIPI